MRKNKSFDCVQMKWDIQQQLRKESQGVPEPDARQAQMQRVAQDPILGPLYKRLVTPREKNVPGAP